MRRFGAVLAVLLVAGCGPWVRPPARPARTAPPPFDVQQALADCRQFVADDDTVNAWPDRYDGPVSLDGIEWSFSFTATVNDIEYLATCYVWANGTISGVELV